MRHYKLLFSFIIITLISGCEFVSYEEFALPEYDGAFDWEQISEKAEWGKIVSPGILTTIIINMEIVVDIDSNYFW